MTAQAVEAANEAFYRAFRERDYPAMAALWSRTVEVVCTHPGLDAIHGLEPVLRSWRGILFHDEAPQLFCSRVRVQMMGEAAFVTCLEGRKGQPPALIATNLFIRESGSWRLVSHQSGPLSKNMRGEHDEPPPDTTVWN